MFGYCNNYLRSNACISKVGYDVYGIFQTADSEGGHSTPLPITYSYLTKYLILIPIALGKLCWNS